MILNIAARFGLLIDYSNQNCQIASLRVTYKAQYSSTPSHFSKNSAIGDENMKLARNRKALSTVVTTLIILVVSVLLATVVTFYAINVTTTRVQEESLFLTKQHVWYNTSGSWAQTAIVIVNTGGRDAVIDKLSVRGQECTWSNVYFWRTNGVVVTDDLQVTATEISGATFDITVQGSARTFNQSTSDITLKSGWTIVIYAMNPGSISLNDVGLTVGITAFTANAIYNKETNVEAAQ